MNENLLRHFQYYIPVSEKLALRLTEIMEEIKIEKGKYLHRPGPICTKTYFINTGLLRVFYKKGDKEITDTFGAEGEWITSINSFLQHIPDNFYIQTLEPSHLISLEIQELEKCFREFPEMERYGRILMSQYFLEQSERMISLQIHSAQERYKFFLKTSGNKIQRIPLGMLSSYLGMTQETLSRIRSHKK